MNQDLKIVLAWLTAGYIAAGFFVSVSAVSFLRQGLTTNKISLIKAIILNFLFWPVSMAKERPFE